MTQRPDDLFDEISNHFFATLIERSLLSEIGATIAKIELKQRVTKPNNEKKFSRITFRIDNSRKFAPQYEWTPEKQFKEKICKADDCYNPIPMFKPNGKYCSDVCKNKQAWKKYRRTAR